MSILKLKRPIVDIAITCSNFEESLRFYHEKLGLEIVMENSIFPRRWLKRSGLRRADFIKSDCRLVTH